MDTVLESALYTRDCIECGSSADAAVAEVLTGGWHEWNLHGTCRKCESEWYECGSGPTPASIRAAILDVNGPSVLELGAGSVEPVAVMRTLRQVRSLTLSQARTMADELLSVGLRGTLVEMEALARLLHATGAVATIRSSSTDFC
ncbi:hypothetical protein [Nocardia arthritidis]|uniref:Uncharacterized protein n=1 Tax=Nocardia arthritidis TaxID=228602 RepID=A0A6G9YIA3_9NOCA|nr:hypothetical protein [Nocardia arthritidis]QIS12766.1 hypothetical protein F5544_24555 [Nocardia arthritidis]